MCKKITSQLTILLVLSIIVYGCREKDKLPELPPSVTTSDATTVEDVKATLNGFVNANNSPTIVSFEYGTTSNYGFVIEATQDYFDGSAYTSVSKEISGLISCQTYHFRIKAINAFGEIYGNDLTFTTKVKDIDGNLYDIIKIGTQTWISENLKTTTFNDGTSISLVTDNTTWSSLNSSGYCWYYNDEANYKATYGALYNWGVVGQWKICPTGWHVPDDTEWTALRTYLGGENIAGGKLKEAGILHWLSPNTGATDESGFSALPGGMRNINGSFLYIGEQGYWWSSSYNITLKGVIGRGFNLNYNNSELNGSLLHSTYRGLSIRCLKDN